MKCPVCDNELHSSTDYLNYTLCEEYAECKDEKHYYKYNYAYGNTEEVIGNVAFYSHYSNSAALRKLQTKQYRAIVELEREYYQQQIQEGLN